MSIVIFDLDGTLALIEHRRHFVENGNRQWDAFFEACVDDKPNQPVIKVWNAMAEAGHDMWIFSGRSDQVKTQTKEWLLSHEIFFDKLVMREEGDHQPDDTLKQAWYEGLLNEDQKSNLVCVFDDRQRIVDMWRRNGIVCLQVAEGNF